MRKSRVLGLALVLVCGIALTALSCGRVFDPYWEIKTLRVMAIKSSPITVKFGQTARISALVFAPDEQEIEYEWSWCPVQTNAQNLYKCPFEAEDLLQLMAARQDDTSGNNSPDSQSPEFSDEMLEQLTFELGNEPTADFLNPFPPAMIMGFCREVQEQFAQLERNSELAGLIPRTDCEQGLDVFVRLHVRAGGEEIIAAKKVTLWGGSEQFNSNPELIDMQIRLGEDEEPDKYRDILTWLAERSSDREDEWVSIPDDALLPLLAGVTYELRALVTPESVEQWMPPVPRGAEDDESFEQEEVTEALQYRWFSTLRQIENSRRLFVDGANTLEEASITSFIPEVELFEECTDNGDAEECVVNLWNVVRDGRLGLDWIGRQVVVIGTAE